MDLLLTHGYYLAEDPDENHPYPPLGILYLSSHLKERGFDVEIFDTTFASMAEFDRRLAASRPPVVGISGNLRTRRNVLEMMRRARAHGAIVVLGGPEPYSYHREYLERGADVVVRGEGEATLAELLPHLLARPPGAPSGLSASELDEVPGIAYRNAAGEVIETGERAPLAELDAQPFPDRDAIDLPRYLDVWRRERGKSAVSLITARGCAYRCTWCSHSVFGFSHRRRSPRDVADEVEKIVQSYDPDMLWYADDVFTVHHRWLDEYADELQQRGLHIPFEAISREDRLDERIIRTLSQMGCYRLWVGAESGSQRVLDAMQRRTNAARMGEVIGLLRQYGIESGTFIMLGYEGETEADIDATVGYLQETAPDTFLTTIAYPIKGTEYYRQVADRLLSPTSWEEGSDRNLTVAGRRSLRYYRFAIRWMVAKVSLRRVTGGGVGATLERAVLLLNATLGRIGMLCTRHQVESARGNYRPLGAAATDPAPETRP